jgi:hypothetical protein
METKEGLRVEHSNNSSRNISTTIVQVAAILIALGVVLKMYRMQSQRSDDRAFARLRREVNELEISEDGKDALQGVVTLAGDLSREARNKLPATDA